MRWLALVIACAAVFAACGDDGGGEADEPDCLTETTDGHASGTTTTLDPACVSGIGQAGGEVWEGPVTGHLTTPDCTPTEPAVTGEISLNVDEEGDVTGTVSEDAAPYECGGTTADTPAATYEITGTKTSDAFDLSADGTSFRMDINDGIRAATTFDTPGTAGYASTVTYSVECSSC